MCRYTKATGYTYMSKYMKMSWLARSLVLSLTITCKTKKQIKFIRVEVAVVYKPSMARCVHVYVQVRVDAWSCYTVTILIRLTCLRLSRLAQRNDGPTRAMHLKLLRSNDKVEMYGVTE